MDWKIFFSTFGVVFLAELGDTVARFIRPEIIRYGAASLFIIIGVLMFSGKV